MFVEYTFEQDFRVQLTVFINLNNSETVQASSFVSVK